MPNGDEAATAQPEIFLSYSRADSAEVEEINQLLRLRVRTFFDAEAIETGDFWPEVLETALRQVKGVAVFLGRAGLGPWQKREVFFAIDRQVVEETAKRPFAVIPIVLPGVQDAAIKRGFLSLYNWIDLRKTQRGDAVEAVVRALAKTAEQQAEAPRGRICPYLGLARFSELDAPLYFGREAFAQQLFEKLQQHELTAVVGASGSGKSSLVFAGLIPKLRRQRTPTWEALSFTPGDDPWRSLANAFMEFVAPELKAREKFGSFQDEAFKLANNLRTDPSGLRSSVERLLELSRGSNRLLIIVDQFEELFTLTAPGDRSIFLEFLRKASKLASVRIVLTLRADYYGSAIDLDWDFATLLAAGQVTLLRMNDEQVLSVVTSPAKVAGLEIETALLDQIKIEMQGQANSLPLLEHALVEVWKRGNSKLTFANYVACGRIAGAISKSAEDLFASLTAEEQDAARRLFLQLVRTTNVGQEGSETRAPARKRDLDELCWAVALKFADPMVRLLVVSAPVDAGSKEEGSQTVEVAHEALIRSWDRLKAWINEDRDFLLWRQGLALKISEWERIGGKEAGLLSGAFLEEAQRIVEQRGNDLTQAEIGFIRLPLGDEFQIEKLVSQAERISPDAQPDAAALWKTLLYLYRPDRDAITSGFPEQTVLNLATISLQRGDPERAFEYAKLVSSAKRRADLLADIADRFAELGDLGRVQFVLTQAREAIEQTKGTHSYYGERQPILVKIFRALARAQQLPLALEIAKQFDEPNAKYFEAAALEFLKAGRWQDALELTSQVADTYGQRPAATIALISALERPSDPAIAEAIARTAVAQTSKDYWYRTAFGSLASALVQAQCEIIALKLAREQPEENGDRAEALVDVGRAFLSTDKNRASELSKEAWQCGLATNDMRRKDVLVKVIQLWAEAGCAESALQPARALNNDNERAYAFIEAATFYAQAKQEDLAAAALAEAESYACHIERYRRNDVLANIVGLYLSLDRVSKASAAARAAVDANQRGQIYITVLQRRLKEFQLAHLDAIQGELLQAAVEDESYGRDRILAALLDLLRDRNLDVSWIFERLNKIQNPHQERAVLSFLVSYVRGNQSQKEALNLLQSLLGPADKDALLLDYIVRHPAEDHRDLIRQIGDAKVRDAAIEKVAAAQIRAGQLDSAQALIEDASDDTLKDTINGNLAVAYGDAGHYAQAVEHLRRLEYANPELVYGAIRQTIRWNAEDMQQASKRLEGLDQDISPTRFHQAHDYWSREFAVRLLLLGYLRPLELVLSLLRTAGKNLHAKRAKRQSSSATDFISEMIDWRHKDYAYAALAVAYARGGDAGNALEMVNRMADAQFRCEVLADAAVIPSGNSIKDRLIDRGIACARNISIDYRRRQALTAFVVLLAARGQIKQAVDLAREASASDKEFVSNLIAAIKPGLNADIVQNLRTEALQSIAKLSNSYEQQSSLESLVLALIAAGFNDEACDCAQQPADAANRMNLLAAAVQAFAKKKAEPSAEKAALLAARDIDASGTYDQTKRKIALVKALRTGGWDQTALRVARQFAPEPDTGKYAETVGPILVASGFVDEAIELANSFPNVPARTGYLSNLIPTSGTTADHETALMIARKALELWVQVKKIDFSERFSLVAFGTKLAESSAWEFFGLVPPITEPAARIAIFTGQVKGLLQKGNAKMALSVAETAFENCAKIVTPWDRRQAVSDLIEVLTKANLQDSPAVKDHISQLFPPAATEPVKTADQIALNLIWEGALEEALKSTASIADAALRIKLSTQISSELIERGHSSQAEELIKEAEPLAHGVGDRDERARSWARLAKAWASLRRYQHSRELAERCYRPNEQLLAYCAILQNYLASTQPAFAPALAAIPHPEI